MKPCPEKFLMKNFFAFLCLTPVLALTMIGCNKTETKPQDEKVSVYFTYNLPSNNGMSMTKMTNADIFKEFYASILSAELVAEEYELILTDVQTGARYEVAGKWNSHDMVTLSTGVYQITGASKAKGDNIQEKCSFIFNEQIELSASSSSITLSAQYDCALLIFNAQDIVSISNYNGEALTPLFSFGKFKYAFVNDMLFKNGKQSQAYIQGVYSDGAEFMFLTGNASFEKGKYYVYNSIAGGFNVPEMEEGQQEGGDSEQTNAIDLGLSVKWAKCNLGATSPAQFGNYYSWGETEPYDYLREYNGPGSDNGGKSVLDAKDDAASVLLGGTWRIPTAEEWTELANNCDFVWTSINGVYGYNITSKKTGYESASIFIPAAGFWSYNTFYPASTIYDGDYYGDYITSSTNYKEYHFTDSIRSLDSWGVSDGRTIRPVCNK